jgi:RNA polymerase sigma factor (sigma-70 family)
VAVTRSRDQQEDAFDALFLAEWPKVVRIAQRVLGEGSQAEDAAQEVFLAFYRRFAEKLPERPGPWLYAAASHVALNALRGERRRDRRERAHVQDAATAAEDPAGELLAREAAKELRSALARLKPQSAQVLALRYAGLRYQEISETIGIPVGQVGTRLRRAEQALRKELAHASSQGR